MKYYVTLEVRLIVEEESEEEAELTAIVNILTSNDVRGIEFQGCEVIESSKVQ